MRTWQRRIEEGLVPRLGDGRGALVPFSAVRPALAVDLSDEDVQMLVRADQGDAAAQADVGARFALAALQEAEAGRGGDALVAPDAARGGGGGRAGARTAHNRCVRRPSRARPTPCTGWGCCMRPGWARATARRWR